MEFDLSSLFAENDDEYASNDSLDNEIVASALPTSFDTMVKLQVEEAIRGLPSHRFSSSEHVELISLLAERGLGFDSHAASPSPLGGSAAQLTSELDISTIFTGSLASQRVERFAVPSENWLRDSLAASATQKSRVGVDLVTLAKVVVSSAHSDQLARLLAFMADLSIRSKSGLSVRFADDDGVDQLAQDVDDISPVAASSSSSSPSPSPSELPLLTRAERQRARKEAAKSSDSVSSAKLTDPKLVCAYTGIRALVALLKSSMRTDASLLGALVELLEQTMAQFFSPLCFEAALAEQSETALLFRLSLDMVEELLLEASAHAALGGRVLVLLTAFYTATGSLSHLVSALDRLARLDASVQLSSTALLSVLDDFADVAEAHRSRVTAELADAQQKVIEHSINYFDSALVSVDDARVLDSSRAAPSCDSPLTAVARSPFRLKGAEAAALYYFEVTVELPKGSGGGEAAISVGVVPKQSWPHDVVVGCGPGSFALNLSRHTIVCGSSTKASVARGVSGRGLDVIGVGVEQRGVVWFTLNGSFVGLAGKTDDAELYPAVSIGGPTTRVRVQFTGPFRYQGLERKPTLAAGFEQLGAAAARAGADQVKVSVHKHVLHFDDADNGWSCDGRLLDGGCRSGVTGFNETTGVRRMRCTACDYDLCPPCIAAYREAPPADTATTAASATAAATDASPMDNIYARHSNQRWIAERFTVAKSIDVLATVPSVSAPDAAVKIASIVDDLTSTYLHPAVQAVEKLPFGIDLSRATFESLRSLIAYCVGDDERLGASEAHAYLLLAALRILKVNFFHLAKSSSVTPAAVGLQNDRVGAQLLSLLEGIMEGRLVALPGDRPLRDVVQSEAIQALAIGMDLLYSDSASEHLSRLLTHSDDGTLSAAHSQFVNFVLHLVDKSRLARILFSGDVSSIVRSACAANAAVLDRLLEAAVAAADDDELNSPLFVLGTVQGLMMSHPSASAVVAVWPVYMSTLLETACAHIDRLSSLAATDAVRALAALRCSVASLVPSLLNCVAQYRSVLMQHLEPLADGALRLFVESAHNLRDALRRAVVAPDAGSSSASAAAASSSSPADDTARLAAIASLANFAEQCSLRTGVALVLATTDSVERVLDAPDAAANVRQLAPQSASRVLFRNGLLADGDDDERVFLREFAENEGRGKRLYGRLQGGRIKLTRSAGFSSRLVSHPEVARALRYVMAAALQHTRVVQLVLDDESIVLGTGAAASSSASLEATALDPSAASPSSSRAKFAPIAPPVRHIFNTVTKMKKWFRQQRQLSLADLDPDDMDAEPISYDDLAAKVIERAEFLMRASACWHGGDAAAHAQSAASTQSAARAAAVAARTPLRLDSSWRRINAKWPGVNAMIELLHSVRSGQSARHMRDAVLATIVAFVQEGIVELEPLELALRSRDAAGRTLRASLAVNARLATGEHRFGDELATFAMQSLCGALTRTAGAHPLRALWGCSAPVVDELYAHLGSVFRRVAEQSARTDASASTSAAVFVSTLYLSSWHDDERDYVHLVEPLLGALYEASSRVPSAPTQTSRVAFAVYRRFVTQAIEMESRIKFWPLRRSRPSALALDRLYNDLDALRPVLCGADEASASAASLSLDDAVERAQHLMAFALHLTVLEPVQHWLGEARWFRILYDLLTRTKLVDLRLELLSLAVLRVVLPKHSPSIVDAATQEGGSSEFVRRLLDIAGRVLVDPTDLLSAEFGESGADKLLAVAADIYVMRDEAGLNQVATMALGLVRELLSNGGEWLDVVVACVLGALESIDAAFASDAVASSGHTAVAALAVLSGTAPSLEPGTEVSHGVGEVGTVVATEPLAVGADDAPHAADDDTSELLSIVLDGSQTLVKMRSSLVSVERAPLYSIAHRHTIEALLSATDLVAPALRERNGLRSLSVAQLQIVFLLQRALASGIADPECASLLDDARWLSFEAALACANSGTVADEQFLLGESRRLHFASVGRLLTRITELKSLIDAEYEDDEPMQIGSLFDEIFSTPPSSAELDDSSSSSLRSALVSPSSSGEIQAARPRRASLIVSTDASSSSAASSSSSAASAAASASDDTARSRVLDVVSSDCWARDSDTSRSALSVRSATPAPTVRPLNVSAQSEASLCAHSTRIYIDLVTRYARDMIRQVLDKLVRAAVADDDNDGGNSDAADEASSILASLGDGQVIGLYRACFDDEEQRVSLRSYIARALDSGAAIGDSVADACIDALAPFVERVELPGGADIGHSSVSVSIDGAVAHAVEIVSPKMPGAKLALSSSSTVESSPDHRPSFVRSGLVDIRRVKCETPLDAKPVVVRVYPVFAWDRYPSRLRFALDLLELLTAHDCDAAYQSSIYELLVTLVHEMSDAARNTAIYALASYIDSFSQRCARLVEPGIAPAWQPDLDLLEPMLRRAAEPLSNPTDSNGLATATTQAWLQLTFAVRDELTRQQIQASLIAEAERKAAAIEAARAAEQAAASSSAAVEQPAAALDEQVVVDEQEEQEDDSKTPLFWLSATSEACIDPFAAAHAPVRGYTGSWQPSTLPTVLSKSGGALGALAKFRASTTSGGATAASSSAALSSSGNGEGPWVLRNGRWMRTNIDGSRASTGSSAAESSSSSPSSAAAADQVAGADKGKGKRGGLSSGAPSPNRAAAAASSVAKAQVKTFSLNSMLKVRSTSAGATHPSLDVGNVLLDNPYSYVSDSSAFVQQIVFEASEAIMVHQVSATFGGNMRAATDALVYAFDALPDARLEPELLSAAGAPLPPTPAEAATLVASTPTLPLTKSSATHPIVKLKRTSGRKTATAVLDAPVRARFLVVVLVRLSECDAGSPLSLESLRFDGSLCGVQFSQRGGGVALHHSLVLSAEQGWSLSTFFALGVAQSSQRLATLLEFADGSKLSVAAVDGDQSKRAPAYIDAIGVAHVPKRAAAATAALGAARRAGAEPSIKYGKWHHLMAIMRPQASGNVLELFVDGLDAGSVPCTLGGTVVSIGNALASIGGDDDAATEVFGHVRAFTLAPFMERSALLHGALGGRAARQYATTPLPWVRALNERTTVAPPDSGGGDATLTVPEADQSGEPYAAIVSHGVRSGTWYFEVRLGLNMSVAVDVRVGYVRCDLSKPLESPFAPVHRVDVSRIGSAHNGWAWSPTTKTLWTEGKRENRGTHSGRYGSTVGCLLNASTGAITWSLDGRDVGASVRFLPRSGRVAYYPAVSISRSGGPRGSSDVGLHLCSLRHLPKALAASPLPPFLFGTSPCYDVKSSLVLGAGASAAALALAGSSSSLSSSSGGSGASGALERALVSKSLSKPIDALEKLRDWHARYPSPASSSSAAAASSSSAAFSWTFALDAEFVGYVNARLDHLNPGTIHGEPLTTTSVAIPEAAHFIERGPTAAQRATRWLQLRELDGALRTLMPFVNAERVAAAAQQQQQQQHMAAPRSASALFALLKPLMLSYNKREVVNLLLGALPSSEEMPSVSLQQLAPTEDFVPTFRTSVFAQLWRQLGDRSASYFSNKRNRVWRANYVGQGSSDYGGPYRESWSTAAVDLVTRDQDLFVPTTNQVSRVGAHRDCYVPRASSTNARHRSMYRFLGRLMGMCIMCGQRLQALRLPPFAWKKLVGQAVSAADLRDVDVLVSQRLETIMTDDPELFEDVARGQSFTVKLSDGSAVPLCPNGDRVPLALDNRREYCAAVLDARLREGDQQVAWIREALAEVIPSQVLSLFGWDDLRSRISGPADFDVDQLKSEARYCGYSSSATQVKMLFALLKELTPEDRAAFLRFVSGQSTLSPKGTPGYWTIEISRDHGSDPDSRFPRAATCSTEIYLPSYTNKEVMRERLLYAIHNCTAIDTDGSPNSQLGTVDAMQGSNWDEM
jgi:HECT-domain (ubiquitin-transferase)/SPRY domain